MVEKTQNREILSAALSAHVGDLRLFWRETGLACRWLVPDSEHCYVDRETVEHLRAFREKAQEKIASPQVCAQWLEKSAPLLADDDISCMPFPLRTLTWLLRVVESPHRDDLAIDSWNLYLWNVRLSDLPSHIMRKLSVYLDTQGKQALIDFDTLATRFVTALEAGAPQDGEQIEAEDKLRLMRRFDLVRRFKNIVFYGIANIGKANLSKQIIQHWQSMTGRAIGMHCITVFHANTTYADMVERRIPGDISLSRPPIESCAPRVLCHHFQGEAKFFFEPFTSENIQEGLLLTLCRTAAYHPDKDYVFMVDCIDEARLDDVLGEVSHMLDSFARVPWRKGEDGEPGAWDLDAPGARTIRLSQSGRLFFIPSNVYILGTANENGLFSQHNDDHLFQTFAVEYLPAKNSAQLRDAMLSQRSLEEFARLEQYATHSIELWEKINEILIRVGGHKNMIGYGPLLSMCEEILQSADVHDANRIVLGTWRYRMIPMVRAKMEILLKGDDTCQKALNDLISCLNQSWLRIHAEIEGMPHSESIYMIFEQEFLAP